ncbi:MAG: hypothetical protein HYX27_16985 [Acidobacteria bacterium]|nr:hypothetical protein [Acidobacteriota bacterium]
MGFLDNLENTLKNAERGAEREDERAASVSRAAEMEALRAAAPHAEALKNGKWTQDLLTQCVTLGHGQRTRVGMAWIGTTLRLDAKLKRMDLQPTANGVEAVFSVDGTETGREMVDLQSDPQELAAKWLATS